LNKYCKNFTNNGNTDSRAILDSGKYGNNKLFWIKIVSAFHDETNKEYAALQFIYNNVFAFEIIDPGKVNTHNWKKLRTIWKTINSKYKQASAWFTLIGTQKDIFSVFAMVKMTYITYVCFWR
jgi:hypothetical protein